MKGKTGKSKMRGGGMARKGVGAAMKSGGKVKKMADQVTARHGSDINEAVPTSIFQRAMFRRKHGNPDDMKLRKSMVDAADKRRKRDFSLLNTYGEDAMKARSFMSEDRPKSQKKAGGGAVKKMANGGRSKGKK